MEKVINNFNRQFAFEPVVENAKKLKLSKKFVVSGMGGSHLAADLIKGERPGLDLIIHHNYQLPADVKNRLIIISSYSGNTEEAISGFKQALAKKLPLAVVTSNGQLLKLSQKNKIPYVQLPETGIQPRSALGFSFRGLLKLIGEEKLLKESGQLAEKLDPAHWQKISKKLAAKLKNIVPVIHSSEKNQALALYWKINFNETSKIPSFFSAFPELNHNEMTGFDVVSATKSLSANFSFIFLEDIEDLPRIRKRMALTEKLYKERGFKVIEVKLEGKTRLIRLFSSIILSEWTAFHLARQYRVEPEEVPMIDQFKQLIK